MTEASHKTNELGRKLPQAELDVIYEKYGGIAPSGDEVDEPGDDDEEEDGTEGLLEEICEFLIDYASYQYGSSDDGDAERPGQSSAKVWFWDRDVAGIRAKFLARFLP